MKSLVISDLFLPHVMKGGGYERSLFHSLHLRVSPRVYFMAEKSIFSINHKISMGILPLNLV